MRKARKLIRDPAAFVRDSRFVRPFLDGRPKPDAGLDRRVRAPDPDKTFATLLTGLIREGEFDAFEKARNVALRYHPDSPTVSALAAEAHLARGDHERLRGVAESLVEKDRNPLGHYYLAHSKYLFGRFDEAIEHLYCLLYDQPGHADGTYLLAQSLAETGRSEAAWRALEDLTRVSSRPKTWLVMANLVQTPGDYQRILTCWREWQAERQSKPTFNRHIAEYIALGALRCEHYQMARHVWRGALLEAATSEHGFGHLKPKTVAYSTGRAERSLLDLNGALRTAGIEMFLVSGTLLGCVREGRLLSHDKDVDVGVWDTVGHAAVLSAVRETGLFYVLASRSDRIIRLKHVSGVGVDVFFHTRSADDYAHGGVKMTWHNSPFDLVPTEFLGDTFLIPSDHDRYLTENYGDWKTPKVDFDSAFDTPNGEVFHEGELLIHIYRGVMDSLIKGSMARTAFYLDELRTRGEGAFVDRFSRLLGS